MAQSTQWGHVERGQFTLPHVYWAGLVLKAGYLPYALLQIKYFFNQKNIDIVSFLMKTCCRYSFEVPWQGTSNE